MNRRREQLPARAAFLIDEDADSGEHRVQRDQQSDRADRDVRLVARTRVQRLLQRRRDHECEENRREQRNEELARRPRGEREPSGRERPRDAETAASLSRSGKCDVWADSGHASPFSPVRRR